LSSCHMLHSKAQSPAWDINQLEPRYPDIPTTKWFEEGMP
jgi:hypothetical protein